MACLVRACISPLEKSYFSKLIFTTLLGSPGSKSGGGPSSDLGGGGGPGGTSAPSPNGNPLSPLKLAGTSVFKAVIIGSSGSNLSEVFFIKLLITSSNCASVSSSGSNPKSLISLLSSSIPCNNCSYSNNLQSSFGLGASSAISLVNTLYAELVSSPFSKTC